jgi:spore germination cell wall hydrolase CwlJ-like protein
MATNVYREARGESVDGQVAVTRVVMNRMSIKEYPNTACGVIYAKNQFSWTSKYKSIVYDQQSIDSVILAYNSNEEFTATHYHNTSVKPSWRKQLKQGVTIGNHTFYAP